MDMGANSDIENRVAAPAQSAEDARLRERYGTYLEDMAFSADQEAELLRILWQIMFAAVDQGLSVAPGDTFSSKSDIGMDDVLHSLLGAESKSLSVPPKKHNNKKES